MLRVALATPSPQSRARRANVRYFGGYSAFIEAVRAVTTVPARAGDFLDGRLAMGAC